MDFPMSSFKIKLLKALITTNTPPLLPTKTKTKNKFDQDGAGGGGGAIAVPFLCLQCSLPFLAPLSPGLFVFLPLETEEDNDNPWNEVAFVFRHFFQPKCRVTRY